MKRRLSIVLSSLVLVGLLAVIAVSTSAAQTPPTGYDPATRVTLTSGPYLTGCNQGLSVDWLANNIGGSPNQWFAPDWGGGAWIYRDKNRPVAMRYPGFGRLDVWMNGPVSITGSNAGSFGGMAFDEASFQCDGYSSYTSGQQVQQPSQYPTQAAGQGQQGSQGYPSQAAGSCGAAVSGSSCGFCGVADGSWLVNQVGGSTGQWTAPTWSGGAWVFRSKGHFVPLRYPGFGRLDVWMNGPVSITGSNAHLLNGRTFDEASFHCVN